MSREINSVLSILWIGMAVVLFWALTMGLLAYLNEQPAEAPVVQAELKVGPCWSTSLSNTGLGSSGPCVKKE